MNKENSKYEINDESLEQTNGGIDIRGIAETAYAASGININEIVKALREKYPDVDVAINAFLADMYMFGEAVFKVASALKESQIRQLIRNKWNSV